MKIVFENFDKGNLIKCKKIIENILNSDTEEMEFTEENLKKAKGIIDDYYDLKTQLLIWTSAQIKVVSSDGTELTRMF